MRTHREGFVEELRRKSSQVVASCSEALMHCSGGERQAPGTLGIAYRVAATVVQGLPG